MYEVIVQNIGKVHEGDDSFIALNVYRRYVRLSDAGLGRASGEGVTLWRNGEIIEEHTGFASIGDIVDNIMNQLRK